MDSTEYKEAIILMGGLIGTAVLTVIFGAFGFIGGLVVTGLFYPWPDTPFG